MSRRRRGCWPPIGGAEAGTLDGVVVSFDECGPISLRPHPGRCWAPRKRTHRQRATFHRTQGVRKLLGAYDVDADRLGGHLESRRVTAKVVLEFLRDSRRRYPAETTVYIVLHGQGQPVGPLDPRHHRLGRRQQRRAPGNADQRQPLNRIECHFWAYVEFVINGSDYPDWATFSKATQACIRRRNPDHHDPRIRDLQSRRRLA